MLHKGRLFVVAVALLLAVIAAAITCTALLILVEALSMPSGYTPIVFHFPVLYFAPALLLVVFFGIPLFAFFSFKGLVRWWTALLSGLACGGLFNLLFDLLLGNGPDPSGLLINAVVGGATALAFWLVWMICAGKKRAT